MPYIMNDATQPKHMNVTDMLPLLQQWSERHAALSKQMDALSNIFGGTFDGPLFDAVWLTWEAYTDQLAHRIGDTADWLHWYCGDNAMGTKGLEVSSYSRKIKVRTLRQLATVIVGSR